MASQFDEHSQMLTNEFERKNEASLGEWNLYCEARSKFFDRLQMSCKGNYELEHTSICKNSHMPHSKGTKLYIYIQESYPNPWSAGLESSLSLSCRQYRSLPGLCRSLAQIVPLDGRDLRYICVKYIYIYIYLNENFLLNYVEEMNATNFGCFVLITKYFSL